MVKKTPAPSDGPQVPQHSCTQWDIKSEAALINFLLEHILEAGNSLNFKFPTFKKAAAYLAPLTVKGGVKNGTSCKNKWARVRTSPNHPHITLTCSDEGYLFYCAWADGAVGVRMERERWREHQRGGRVYLGGIRQGMSHASYFSSH